MPAIVPNIATIQTYINIGFDFTWSQIEPFSRTAERQNVKSLLGTTLYDAWVATPPTTGNALKAYNLFQEAISNLAVLKYIPTGSVGISDAGVFVNASEHTKQPEWWQIRDLQRSLLDNAMNAIDEALEIMEANEGDFTGWAASSGYTIFKELFTQQTAQFQRHFNISNSRRTFLALRPFMLEAQNQAFNWLDSDTFNEILTASNDTRKVALDFARAAQVNYTVAKAAESGLFELTASGMFLKSTELPGDKTKEISEQQLYRLMQSRLQAGDEYLKKLKAFIIANPSEFTNYTESTTAPEIFVHNTKSIVTF